MNFEYRIMNFQLHPPVVEPVETTPDCPPVVEPRNFGIETTAHCPHPTPNCPPVVESRNFGIETTAHCPHPTPDCPPVVEPVETTAHSALCKNLTNHETIPRPA